MKNKNIYELDPERLATTDEHGYRVYLYPEDVHGKWKNRRTIFYWFLIIFYLVLPWFYINNKPALMVNIFAREFTVFGFTLYGVEPILFFLIVASGIFFIAFMTSQLGRVWCGWACPQTVFIQTIFMKVETLIEGKARQRREFDKAPLSLNKFSRKSLKWLVFTAMSLHIAHTFLGYFIGPRELFLITMHSPTENPGIFFATMIVTAILLLDFGWFREQFCIIACPYGRMQSVIMDENSLVISYDVKRGEPRRGTDSVSRENEGDCINCYACVKVCPTGIDIRRGTQLECIACTQCVDACNDIMSKIKKPAGLIRYSTENEINAKKRKKLTIRSTIYISISILFVSAFIYFLNASTNLQMVFLRSKTPFQVIESGQTIVNHFTLKLTHQGSEEFKINFRVADPELQNKIQVVIPVHPTIVNNANKKIVVFFKFSPDVLISGTRNVRVEAFDPSSGLIVSTKEVVLVGPAN